MRGVVSWNQHMILIRPLQKNLVCTQVLLRGKKGQNLEGIASDFLMGNGLSGILVDDSWLDVILPWFPVAFLVMLIRTVSRWLYEMEHEIWENGIQRNREKKIDFRKCSCFVIRILLWGIGLFFCVRLLSHIDVYKRQIMVREFRMRIRRLYSEDFTGLTRPERRNSILDLDFALPGKL